MLPAVERPAVRLAIAENPVDRWPSCRAFVATVTAAAATGPATSREPNPKPSAAPPRIRRRWPAVLAAATLAAGVVVAAVVSRPWGKPPPAEGSGRGDPP